MAIFSGAYVPATIIPKVVTVSSGITANSLHFVRNGYSLTGGDITLAGLNASLGANLGVETVIDSKISGTDGLTILGGGSIRLGNSANDYTGTMLIRNGSLIISDGAALGASASPISILTTNDTPGSAAQIGFGGGSLVLDGSAAGFTFGRDVNFDGRGPIGDRSAAIVSLGNNTLSGTLTSAVNGLTPVTLRNSRINSVNGTLTISGTLNSQGTAASTFLSLGGINTTGSPGLFNLTGVLTGTGSIEKSGAGTLHLNPSSSSGFLGTIRVSASASSAQSSVRITSPGVIGANAGGGTSGVLDMNGGVLEVRMDNPLVQNTGGNNANVYGRAASTFFVDHAIGGHAINGNVAFGNFTFEESGTAFTFNGRNGYGLSFTTAPVNGGNNDSTFTNNLPGLLSFTGNFWSNTDNGAGRTMTIGGNGNTLINGNVNATSVDFNHNLTKTGVGVLALAGTNSTLDGNVNINGGAVAVRDFRSVNNNVGSGQINIGTGGTAGALIIGVDGFAPTTAGLTTAKTINLAGTTATASIYANQAGADPVILNGSFTATGGSNTQNKTLVLGGTNTADNIISGNITNNDAGGTVSLLKTGSGTWVLAGANTFTGTTTLSNGTLKLNANAEASTVLGSSNAITFNTNNEYAGAQLEFVGQVGTNNVQTVGTVTSTAGANTMRLVPGAGGMASLTITTLTPAVAGSINFVGGDSVNNLFTVAGADGLVNRTYYFDGADFAYRSGNVLRVPVYGTDVGFSTTATDPLTANAHQEITGSLATNSATIFTLKINGPQTLTINSGQTLTVSNAAGASILATGGASAISGGTVAAGGTGLILRTNGETDSLAVSSLITGTAGWTKNGDGTLVLSGANTITGTQTINEGTVQLSGTGRLGGAANLSIRQGATLDLNGVTPFSATNLFNNNGTVTNTSGTAATFTVGNNNQGGTSFGIVSGNLNLTKVGTAAQNWYGQSDYTGVTTIGGTGLVTVDYLENGGMDSGIGASSSAASNLVFNTGLTGGLSYRGDNVNGILSLGSRSSTTDRLFTLTGTGLTLRSQQSTNLNNAIVWSNTGDIVHGIVGPQALTFDGSSQGENTFTPRLTDSGTSANITSVTKTGTGIWNLAGSNNTYSGNTTITQGILMAIDGQGLSSNSNLVFDGGTLYSSGALNRDFGTGPGQMRFNTPAADQAEFIGGFLGGDSKLTVSWTGTEIWGVGNFVTQRGGLMLNGSQARAQGATGSIALSEVDIAGNFSLGTASGSAQMAQPWVFAQNSATVNGASTAGLVVGQSIGGDIVPSGAYIVSINSATQFTMSANTANTSAGAGTIANGEAFASALRTIRVDDNGNTGADFATISGIISGDAGTGLNKAGTGILRLTGANTYNGATRVTQGALAVMSLGNSASAGSSSVGTTVNANMDSNAIELGNGGTGAGILQYLGAGEVSDRKIRLNSTTGGNQIHADGAGALILTNVVNDLVGGNKTLFLRGTNTDGNQINSDLADNGGTLAVTIDGGATWVLGGDNTFTGNLNVTAGALGIGSATALGGGGSALVNTNGNVFAFGADRTVANAVTLGNNATNGWLGDYSLIINGVTNLAAAANNVTLNNSIVDGKVLHFAGGMTANALTANRTLTIDGPGETMISGDFTTSTAFGVTLTKVGDGTLNLGTNGATSTWNQNGTNIDIDRGTLKFSANNAINTTVGFGSVILTPEAANGDTATMDLNGTTQTLAAFTATTDGQSTIDNTSSMAADLTFGANNADVTFVGSTANTGSGALSITKIGTGTATLTQGPFMHTGATTVNGGLMTLGADVNGTTSLVVDGTGSTLRLTGSITGASLIDSITVGAGGTLSFLNGAGDKIDSLTALALGGGSGSGNNTLKLNVGGNVGNMFAGTDTLTLLSGGFLSLSGTTVFDLTDVDLEANTTYTLLSATSGLDAGTYVLGATPGGFTAAVTPLAISSTLVQFTTGNLITGDLFWNAAGAADSWNDVANWSTDLAGVAASTVTPGQGSNVIFKADNITGTGAITTTLEQNFRVNRINFIPATSPADTPTAVTIAAGADPLARLTIKPQSPADGINLEAGGPASVTISTLLRMDADQTWTVADAGSTLTVSGALQGEVGLIKAGAGRVVLGAAAAASFNPLMTATVAVNAGTLEITNATALGSSVVGNAADISVNSGGAFYYNGAAGTVSNDLTMNGGTLSAGTATQIYSGAINFAAASTSTINMRDSNSATLTTTQRNITLSGPLSGSGGLIVDTINTAATGNQILGNLTLNNNNSTWSGPLTILRGSVITNQDNSLTTGDINLQAGKIEWQGPNGTTRTVANAITIANPSGIGVGELQVNNSSTPSSPFTVNYTGAVTLGGSGGAGELRIFLADAANSVANYSGDFTLANNGAIHVRDNATLAVATINGNIGETSGARSLVVNGPVAGNTVWGGTAGVLVLNGTNNYTGGTSLAAGTLRLGSKDALGTGLLTVTGASTLQAGVNLSGANAIANALTLSAGLTVAGSENLTIGGTTLVSGANRTITNNLTAGKLTLAGNVTLSNNATARTLTIAGTGDTDITGVVADFSTGSGPLVKSGTGTLTLTNSNTYTGATTINGGVLRAGILANGGTASSIGDSSNAAANLVLGGGTLNYTGATVSTDRNYTLTAATSSGISVSNAAATLTISGASTATTGALTKSGLGTLDLTGINLHTGLTIVSEGTLSVNNTSGIGLAGAVTVASGATLSGAGTIGGAVTVNGTIAAGNSVDMLTVGEFDLGAGGNAVFELSGPTILDLASVNSYKSNPGGFVVPSSWTNYQDGVTLHDHIAITGGAPTFASGSTVTLNTLSYTPVEGDVFQIFSWTGVGAISVIGTPFFNLPALSGLGWNTDFFASHGVAFVVPEPGRAMLLVFGLIGMLMRRRRK